MTSRERLYQIAEEKRGWKVIEELPEVYGETTPFYCEDEKGYRYRTSSNNLYNKGGSCIVHKANKYSLYNIQHFLDLNEIPFDLLDSEYVSNNAIMNYKCRRCGLVIGTRWTNINKYQPDGNKGRIYCPNCDGTLESLQAIALKQVFVHEYPDTIPEERSCINPDTGYSMPTDIVNHRLKIAIEVQSQWHDNRTEKDKIKKDFWIEKGYRFYAPDIREYNVLEMLQLFFDITEIPEYVDFSQANKLNIRQVQKMLDQNLSPVDIGQELNISPHKIYDAIGCKKLHYPNTYKNKSFTSVVCFDMQMNELCKFNSISEAGKAMNVSPSAIVAAFMRNTNYSQGYYWQRIEQYNNGESLIPTKKNIISKP